MHKGLAETGIRDFIRAIVQAEEQLECLRRVIKQRDTDDYLDAFNEIRANSDEVGLSKDNFVTFFRYFSILTLETMVSGTQKKVLI